MWFQMILGSLIFASVLFLQTAVADKCTMWSFEDNKDDNLNNSSASMDIGSVTSITECSLQGISFIKSKVNAYEMNYLLQYDSSQSTAIYKVDGDKYVGKNYVAMTYYGANMVGQIHIAATSSGSTNVKIDLPDLLNFTAPKCTVNYEGKDYINGETIKLTIDQNETVTIKGQCDLTGTFIKGEEKIAVFSGSYTNESSSLSFEQLMPYRMSSTYYILHAYSGVDCENIISVATYVSNTILKISGYDYIIIPRKRQQVRRKIEKNESVYIKSSKPISVMQYIICEHDNAMILVSPIQQDLERKRSLSATCHATKISVPDSNFFTNRYVIDSNYSVDIVDKSGMVYSQYGLFGDGHKIGGSIFDTTFKWKKSVMVPGDGIDNDGDDEIDEDECGDPGDGLDCGKLRYGNTRDQDRTFFIAYSTMDQATDIFSDCDVNNTWYGFAIEIISSYGCSVVLNTNINVGGRSIHLNYSLLPVDVLDQEYYAFTKCSSDSLTFMCNVTAIFNATTIEIKGLEKHTIHAYDTYVLNNETDLSGTFIRANNPVSVVCICIEDSDDDITINTMQLPPVDTWGKQFKFTLLPRNDMDKGQIFCTASTGNTVVIVKIYRGYMDNTITEYVYSKSIFLNIAGDIEGFDFERDTLYSIVAYKAIMVTLVFKLDKNISTVFVTPTEQITDSTNGSNVYTVKIDGFEFRQPFNNYLNIANNFDSINKPFTVTEQTPRDDIDNDGDGLVDEDYCLFLLGDSGLMDLDFDGSYNEDCHGCDAGNELNTAFLTCEQCKIGFYRDGSNKIDKCKPCQFNYTTFFVGSVSADSCIRNCEEGFKFDWENRTCSPCPIGWFKNTSSSNVDLDISERWNCTKCPADHTTYKVASDKCLPICREGQELDSTGTFCKPCDIGFYQNTSSADINSPLHCTKCINSTTFQVGSESCTGNCEEGFKFDWENRTCSPCPIGWFKNTSSSNVDLDISERWNCTKCPADHTTYKVASDKCLPICREGQELDSTGTFCKPCDIGFYQNTSSADINSPLHCTKCINSTTFQVGSESCTDICDVGYELIADGSCIPCHIGYFKNVTSDDSSVDPKLRWNCTYCGVNKTTYSTGSTSSEECFDICDVGYELNKATESCIPCQIGYFKNVTSDDSSVDPKLKWKCTYCGVNKTTYSTGSTSSEECIDSCESGYQLAADNKTCEKCPRNTSKNDASIYTRCKPCPLNQITMSDGSEICVDLCRPGFEFNNNTKNCQPCKLGFSKREEGNFENCIECGTNSTTKSEGQTECVPASCKCPCNRVHPVVNYTSAELSKVIEQLKKELKVNKEKLSSTLRRKTSVKDNRPSSKTFGAFSITVIVAVFLLFLIFDFVMIKHHVQIFMENVRDICP